jgi:hypothetical protein
MHIREELGAEEPQEDLDRQTEGQNMILPGNDFANEALGKMICGRNDSRFAQAGSIPIVCSAKEEISALFGPLRCRLADGGVGKPAANAPSALGFPGYSGLGGAPLPADRRRDVGCR